MVAYIFWLLLPSEYASVTIPSSQVQFTFSLLLLSEQHAANACSSYLYHSSCIMRMLHASDACLSFMPLPLCRTHVEHVPTMPMRMFPLI